MYVTVCCLCFDGGNFPVVSLASLNTCSSILENLEGDMSGWNVEKTGGCFLDAREAGMLRLFFVVNDGCEVLVGVMFG